MWDFAGKTHMLNSVEPKRTIYPAHRLAITVGTVGKFVVDLGMVLFSVIGL
jgi:hypothetical protein